ncbi:MAG: tRNA preQ1(34) S-adenosylmethionine ribosyltransferase-isomerase QueA [Cytophagia bacterium]|nr:MAG: tRNA preQ1(34) S-adenosylmethionine ribosyltransferase-isomerase QueA [Cytophagales bacterium]TAG07173.1 MAG: tRNA preQ1(34) S-adenosylmethionine ribosyltransferase-isomerase QueA [Cytophagia bacterium]TAG44398.1 MAG: tRNA preQ1(34) S-adenosylmethionine ribosyltransferase-isomerase QueA [Cytophagia bacterium]TAH29457.1 MAG: tRNA preQ1(34) S-adenosylmethionine ribosyltransferase-isomerase QueA [Cytophagales bacterium]
MKLSEFRFILPDSLIALHPTPNRDEARLMVVHKDTGKIEHKVFKDIIDYFDEKDIVVINDTKVFPARLYGSKEKTGAKIEVFLLRELSQTEHLWDVLVDPARKIRVGNKLFFGDSDLVAEVVDNTTSRGRTIRFLYDKPDFYDIVYGIGETPLPKNIYSQRKITIEDEQRFQTIYAKNIGAVAAPTAGLHFTRQLLQRLELKGVDIAPITLHIGLGTFRSVDVEDLTKHKADSENFEILESSAKMINDALDQKRRICAIGTTTVKALESSVSAVGRLKPVNGWTDKFIFAPYDFKVPNALVTSFHLPQSTLFMTTCTFGGYELIMEAYETAVREKYRFFSYGDAMLII